MRERERERQRERGGERGSEGDRGREGEREVGREREREVERGGTVVVINNSPTGQLSDYNSVILWFSACTKHLEKHLK